MEERIKHLNYHSKMNRINLFPAVLTAVALAACTMAGCTPEESGAQHEGSTPSPVLTISEDQVDVDPYGGTVTILYELTNEQEGGALTAKCPDGTDWVNGINTTSPGQISFNTAANVSGSARQADFIVTYTYGNGDTVSDQIALSQEPVSDFDHEYTDLGCFSGAWYGDRNSTGGRQNYTAIFSDLPLTQSGTADPEGHYYQFDFFAPADADDGRLPEGRYTLGVPFATEAMTFTPENSYVEHGSQRLEFKHGEVDVSVEGSTYVIEGIVTDSNNEVHHIIFRGELHFTDASGAFPPLTADISFEPDIVQASYYGGTSDLMLALFLFSDMQLDGQSLIPPGDILYVEGVLPYDKNGYITPGEYKITNTTAASAYILAPGSSSEDEYTGEEQAIGTYGIHAENQMRANYGFVKSGTMTVTGEEDNITIVCDFTTEDGHRIECSWSGSLTLLNMPGPSTTLKGDYHCDFEGAEGAITWFGDWYGTGTNWMFDLTPAGGPGDGFISEFVSEGGSLEEGIPTGTFRPATLSSNPFAGEYIPGSLQDGYILGTAWLQYANGSSGTGIYGFAPAVDGELSITNNGDGSYTLSFEFTDDAGNIFDGEWTGTPTITDGREQQNPASASIKPSAILSGNRYTAAPKEIRAAMPSLKRHQGAIR